MSKMDGLRAMREARYERSLTQAPLRAAADAAAPASPASRAEPAAAQTEPAVEAPMGADETAATLCGHRAISGRTCTRPQGHDAKSHRYS